MRTQAHLALAALAVVAIAAAGLPATAAAPKCPPGKTTTNKAACTDAVTAKPKPGQKARGKVEHEWKVEEGEMSKRKKGLKSGN